MYHSILQKQKETLPFLLTKKLVIRDILNKAKKELSHNLIKLIVGPRRSGKSTLALQLFQNKDFGYVNFDEPDFDFNAFKYNELSKAIDDVYKNPRYLLLDEIQNLSKWETYLNSLQRTDRNIIVTGSNAKMLSSDLATALTGRSVEIKLYPFSYKEALNAKDKLTIERYLTGGSYPEAIVKDIEPETYFQSLFNTSIIKDVVIRYSIRNPQDLENTAKYLLSNIGNLYSYQSISQKLNLSVPTVIDYIDKLEETYLFFQLPKFSNKQSEISKSNKKIYVVDYALTKYNTFTVSNNYGSALENAVFIELLRKGYICGKTLFYFKTQKNNEIDFLTIEKDRSKSIYQVCYTADDDKTMMREKSAITSVIQEIDKIRRKVIIVKENINKNYHDIELIGFESFCK